MIELKNVKKSYVDWFTEQVLKWINLTIKDGDFLAIMWPSGSGKSTLMNIIWLLDMPDSGEYLLDGVKLENLSENDKADIRGREIWFIFQTFNLVPRLSVIHQVMMPLVYQWVDVKEREERAMKALEKVWIPEKANSLPNELSWWQQQRVAIARAIITNPDIILADEPTWSLDSKNWLEILGIFKKLNEDWNTIVLVTHDANIAKNAKRIIHIKDWDIKEW